MDRHGDMTRARLLSTTLGILLGLLVAPEAAFGQGCMPLHFAFPGLAGQRVNYFQRHDWQIGVAMRRVATNRFFVGTQEDEAAAPGGQPLNLRLNSVDVSLSYAMSDRLSLSLTVPWSYSTAENTFGNGMRNQAASSGLGDINLFGNWWIATPDRHPSGNLSLGLGVKAPTGDYHVTGPAWTRNGTRVEVPLSQTNQLGDGGWAILLSTNAFRQILTKGSVYFSGTYSVSLTQHTDVIWPAANTFWAVPDVYSARLGLAYSLVQSQGLSASLGGRIDGTMTGNLVGGSSDYMRHAGYTIFIDPGVSLQVGPSQFSLNIPVRVYHNYLNQTLSNGSVRIGEGGVGDFVVYGGYTYRF
jgi:hypothetical protein